MLEDVEGDHEILGVSCERQARRVGAEHGQSALVGHLGTVGAVLQSRGPPPGLVEHHRVATPGGTDVDGPARLESADRFAHGEEVE